MKLTMKTAIACALALGVAGAAAGVRAEGLDCCRLSGQKAAACCPTGEPGGKARRLFRIRPAGVSALRAARRAVDRLSAGTVLGK